MKKKDTRKIWITCGALIVVLVCGAVIVGLGGWAAFGGAFSGGSTPTVTNTLLPVNTPTFTLEPTITLTPTMTVNPIPFNAVVQIVAMYYNEYNQLVPGWTGSGSIISPDGLILTNAHVVLSDRFFQVEAIGIAITDHEDQPPVLRYYADVLQYDEDLDIAVIKISTDLNGNPVDTASLNLPFIPLGNADDLSLGDSITILGYPGIGGETITLTRGEVSGFTSEPGRGNRAFIKTNATIAGGNSGGMAADSEGYLIGIPTQLGYGGDSDFVDCRWLADTNNDGVINELDNCVPTGGFINALRPINLALPLIEAAQAGVISSTPEAVPTIQVEVPNAGPVLYEDDFSTVKGDWAFSGDAGSISYVNNQLQVEILQSGYLMWGTAGENLDNVVIEVNVNLQQAAGDGDFGIVCHYQDQDNFYALEVSEHGYFAIWKISNGEFYGLIDWRLSSQLADATSMQITATCTDEVLALSVNGEWLAEVRDNEFTSGDVGVVAGTWQNAPLIVNFDNFVVREAQQ